MALRSKLRVSREPIGSRTLVRMRKMICAIFFLFFFFFSGFSWRLTSNEFLNYRHQVIWSVDLDLFWFKALSSCCLRFLPQVDWTNCTFNFPDQISSFCLIFLTLKQIMLHRFKFEVTPPTCCMFAYLK